MKGGPTLAVCFGVDPDFEHGFVDVFVLFGEVNQQGCLTLHSFEHSVVEQRQAVLIVEGGDWFLQSPDDILKIEILFVLQFLNGELPVKVVQWIVSDRTLRQSSIQNVLVFAKLCVTEL